MKRKRPGHSIERLPRSDLGGWDQVKRELSEAQFEQQLQGLPVAACVLLRFARERGLI